MRYLIALIAGLLMIGAGVLFVQSTQRRLWTRTMTAVEQARDRGEVSEEQYQSVMTNRRLADFGVEVSPAEGRRLQIADLLASFWFVLAPLAFAVCLLAAHLTRPREAPPGP